MQSYDRLLIGGKWDAPATPSVLQVISPLTEEVIAQIPDCSTRDIDRAVAVARASQDHGPWPHMPVAERIGILRKLAAGLRAHELDFARTQSEEVGSPYSLISAIQAEVAAALLDYYLDLGSTYPFEEVRPGLFSKALVLREPVGVVGAIVPWNYPLSLSFFKLAPALLAGCSVILKPDSATPLHSYILGEILQEIGLPQGVMSILPAGREASEHLVTHPDVDKIAFTGSTAVGKRVAALCGQTLKHVSCELGGKSAAILLDDVALDQIITPLIYRALPNNGQTCIAQTRLLVPQTRYAEITEALVERVRTLRVGNPLDPHTEIGPLVTQRQRDRVDGYIASGLAEGAKIAVGGKHPPAMTKGWFVEPTVFVDVNSSMRIAQEEIFGPVLVVLPYADEEEAIALANDSAYGLSGSVWTADQARGIALARRIQTGTIGINNAGLDPAAPFGGWKQSGIGRELGREGLEEYFELKSILLPPERPPAFAAEERAVPGL
ncbi:aldehyde dehydrogenase [Ktedonobacter racemifer]|uniref:aldehyde dehydrogenase (NAD(+)) n=1 Tax=Ktedonobacter racemifer DSM 44963 TaxID=485913 RepID=D6U339_KTERA|nr:aldehyde dehydrogenase [Ktedonobacter racemifer]EFH82944.1 Aldehyde Dehydrogenase [Ktedonobacter racemifer DSM 44963]